MIARIFAGLALSSLVVAASLTVGCSQGAGSGTTNASSSALSAAVAVDFYGNHAVTATCSGTLLAPNVVLTSRHCAEGSDAARVTASGAGGKTSTVSRVFRYAHDPKSPDAVQHDLAVLILRAPIHVATYASVQATSCAGCKVVGVQRAQLAAGAGAVKWTSVMRLAGEPTRANPLALYAPVGTADSGGAVFRTGTGGKPVLVGITQGHSHVAAGSYVSRVDDPEVHAWLGGTLAYGARALAGAAGSVTTKSDPSVDPGTDPGADPTGGSSGASGSSGDPGTPSGDPTSSSSSGGDPQSPADPSTDPSAQNGGAAPTAPDGDSVEQGGVPAAASGDSDEPQPVDGLTRGVIDSGVQGCPAGTSCTTNTQTPGGGACNLSFAPGDGAGQGIQSYCSSSSTSASVVGCHGAPGIMTGCTSDSDALTSMGQRANQNGDPIILASCNGGTGVGSNTPGDPDYSNAANIAQKAGTTAGNVYACCGGLVTAGTGMQCGGSWCDGNGNALSSDARSKYGLTNCTMTSADCTNGKPGCVVNSGCN